MAYIKINEHSPLLDIEVKIKVNKKRSDELTVHEAFKHNKSSKKEKMKHRKPSRDQTRTTDSKAYSKAVRVSHVAKSM
jgi:hypothetical protein